MTTTSRAVCLNRISIRGIIAAAILAVSPCQAMVRGGYATNISAAYNGAFQGNPNPSVSSITPSIVCDRSGTIQTPAFIQCSASPTTYSASGAVAAGGAYEDLEFTWNFGDSGGTETFTHPISGSTVNANNKQWGPEATYVYRSAGTYTITLNVRACASGPATGGACAGGSYTSASVTTSITVSAFSASGGTFYYDTGGSGTACSLASPCAISQLASKMAANTQHNFNCGETFTGTTNISIQNLQHVRIAAGGSACPGANPIININSGTNAPFSANANSGSTGDIVVSHITFQTSGSGQPANALVFLNSSGTATVTDVAYDNISVNDTVGLGGIEGIQTEPNTSTSVSNVVIWGSTVTQPLTGTNCIGILDGAQQWYSIVGVTVTGNGSQDTTKCHHIYIHSQQHVLARWNTGGASCSGASCTPTRNYTIKDSVDCSNISGGISGASDDCVPGYVCPTVCYGFFHLVSENKLFGSTAGRYIGNGNNDPTVTRMKQYVDQQNVFFTLHGLISGTGIFQPITSETLTVRDSLVCVPGDQWFTPNGDNQTVFLRSGIYRNKYFQNAVPGANEEGAIIFGSPTAITWGGGSPLKQVITDNTFQDTTSTGTLMAFIKSSDWVTAGSVIDRNNYDAPNASGNFLSNNGAGVSFASWQGLGWDANGTNGVNPSWPAPASCNFGAWPFN